MWWKFHVEVVVFFAKRLKFRQSRCSCSVRRRRVSSRVQVRNGGFGFGAQTPRPTRSFPSEPLVIKPQTTISDQPLQHSSTQNRIRHSTRRHVFFSPGALGQHRPKASPAQP